MKILRGSNRLIALTLGSQIKETGARYVWSKYTIREGNAVYNCLTDEAVNIEDEEKDKDELIRHWYLVPDDLDVAALSYMVRQKAYFLNGGPGGDTKSVYIIFTTTACNAHCEYCFEKGYDVLTMSEETAADVADYIIRTRKTADGIKIKWFGGEPLLNKKAMTTICKKLKAAGIRYWCEISTNGDILPYCTDEEILLWNPRMVQFTADDIGAEYDRIKGLPNGAYDRLKVTIERLQALLPNIRIPFRIHLNPQKGSEACYKLVDEFKKYPNVKIYPRLLYEHVTEADYDELLKLEEYIWDVGKHRFPIPAFNPATHCMADNRNQACITPTGALSPCEHHAYGKYLYGDVRTKEIDRSILKEWSVKEKVTNKKCTDCVLYPCCKKLSMCPAEGRCDEGWTYYQIKTIKRALGRAKK